MHETRVILVRHGPTLWNLGGRFTSRSGAEPRDTHLPDGALAELARRDARWQLLGTEAVAR